LAKVENKEEILVAATASWVIAHATDTCIQFLDCRNPRTEREFLNALQEHHPRAERRHQFFRDQQRTRLWWQTSHKSGHRTQDCLHGNKPPSHALEMEFNNSKQTQSMLSSNLLCLWRISKSSCINSAKITKSSKGAHKIRWISTSERLHRNVIMKGLIDGKKHMILLDTATDISLFPEEHVVSPGARDGKNVV